MPENVESAQLLALLDATWRRVIAYRFPQVCKHLVAANMLSDLEQAGFVVPRELADAVVNCDDEAALAFPALAYRPDLLSPTPVKQRESEDA